MGCVDANSEAAEATVAWIERERGRAFPVVADVSDAATCERVVADASERLGGLDGIVLNVGIAAGRKLEGTSAELWDLTFAVNLRAHFLLARAALPRIAEGGALVFISSVAGLGPGSLLPAYDASKAGIFGLSRHVALEGSRRGIRANVVVPGLIDTPLGRLASRGRPSRDRTPVPLGRQGTAWEVAYATVFLLSGEASYITGQALVVDGGLSALRWSERCTRSHTLPGARLLMGCSGGVSTPAKFGLERRFEFLVCRTYGGRHEPTRRTCLWPVVTVHQWLYEAQRRADWREPRWPADAAPAHRPGAAPPAPRRRAALRAGRRRVRGDRIEGWRTPAPGMVPQPHRPARREIRWDASGSPCVPRSPRAKSAPDCGHAPTKNQPKPVRRVSVPHGPRDPGRGARAHATEEGASV